MAWGVVGSRSLVPTAIEGWCVCGGWYLNAAPGLLGQGGSQTWKLCKLDFLYYLLLFRPRALGINQLIQGEERRGRRAGALAMV